MRKHILTADNVPEKNGMLHFLIRWEEVRL